ncbi:alpha/beta fold hydrolase [Chryseobacterium sp. 18068]|uniref:alpha/beta fold hydrolase n=1 Tax=Chryseobacterium sp. 18068 TaxID=2681414 RepID=UPI00135A94AA|nr:hypothetical protein [Chryseobacterium sp. 18068]
MRFKYNALLFFNTFFIIFTHAQHLKNGNFIEKIDGISINYTIKGNGPVMFVGHPNSGKIGYELTLQPLEKQFTMVYYDSRGTGKSAAPTKIEDYSLEKSVVEIEELRKKLNIDKIWF